LKGAIFDWDGTLLDIDGREFYSINAALKAHGIAPVTRDFFLHNYYRRPFEVGTGPRMVLETAIRGRSVESEKVYETYRKLFGETVDKAKLQAGATQVLRALKKNGLRIGIATMRFTRSVVAAEFHSFGIEPLVDTLLTREDLGLRRTLSSLEETVEQRVHLVSKVLEELDLSPEETFLVGDSWWDIRAGKQLKMRTVLVKTGFSSHTDFSSEKPDITVESLEGLEAAARGRKWLDGQ
jgi:phosphoglycolate phosphatase-like HAD superfamily hydrolase